MINRLLCSFALIGVTGAAHASETPASVPAEEETIVSATRSEKRVLDIPSAVTVLTQEEIAVTLPANIADVLDNVAAADIRRSGSTLGGTTSLFTRGSSADHTLMLINGQRFSSATLGQAAFELIDPAMVKRLEYVRGSRSSLYGSEALGGVLQLFTYDDNKEPGFVAVAEAGSYDTYRVGVNGSAAAGPAYFNGGLSRTDSSGFDHFRDDSGTSGDDDAFERNTANLFASVDLPNDAELHGSFVEIQTQSDYDSPWTPTDQPFRDKTLRSYQARLILPLIDAWTTDLSLGESEDKNDEFNRSLDSREPTSVFDTERFSAYWQNNIQITDDVELVAGIDYIDEQVNGSVAYDIDDRTNTAPFVQLDAGLGLVDVLLGFREEDNSQFGTHSSGSASISTAVTDKSRVFVSWNEAFKAPTFNDLYWPDLGNSNLLPETSESWEFGYKRGSGSQEIELIAFQSDVENLIDWAFIPDLSAWLPLNVGEVEIKGIEGRYAQKFGALSLELSGSYLSPKDKTTNTDLDFRARRKIATTIAHSLEKWHYGLVLKAYGQRKSGVETLDPYELLDVFVNFDATKNLSFGLKLNNVTDEDYEQTRGYNAEGSNYKLSVKYTL